MKSLKSVGFTAATLAFAATSPALSHHSHAMFDHGVEVEITGTVADYSYRNPHVFLYVDVEQEGGEAEHYWIEMSNIPNMIRRGVGQNTFKVGDEVTVNMWPLKDGRPGGNYITITTADGTIYE